MQANLRLMLNMLDSLSESSQDSQVDNSEIQQMEADKAPVQQVHSLTPLFDPEVMDQLNEQILVISPFGNGLQTTAFSDDSEPDTQDDSANSNLVGKPSPIKISFANVTIVKDRDEQAHDHFSIDSDDQAEK